MRKSWGAIGDLAGSRVRLDEFQRSNVRYTAETGYNLPPRDIMERWARFETDVKPFLIIFGGLGVLTALAIIFAPIVLFFLFFIFLGSLFASMGK